MRGFARSDGGKTAERFLYHYGSWSSGSATASLVDTVTWERWTGGSAPSSGDWTATNVASWSPVRSADYDYYDGIGDDAGVLDPP